MTSLEVLQCIVLQTLFRQNVLRGNSSKFNDVKLSPYTVISSYLTMQYPYLSLYGYYIYSIHRLRIHKHWHLILLQQKPVAEL